MSRSPGARPLLLVVGGCGGLVGRAVLEEFSRDHDIRSVHRHPVAREAEHGVEWVRGDAATVGDWTPLLAGVDTVLNLAWYRQSSAPPVLPPRGRADPPGRCRGPGRRAPVHPRERSGRARGDGTGPSVPRVQAVGRPCARGEPGYPTRSSARRCCSPSVTSSSRSCSGRWRGIGGSRCSGTAATTSARSPCATSPGYSGGRPPAGRGPR